MEARKRQTTKEWIDCFGLRPHPEGGYFCEVFRSEEQVSRGGEARSAITAIYYLLDAGQHSRWHQVDSDEIWQFVAGDPLELIGFDPAAGEVRTVKLGPADAPGCLPIHPIPAGHWQAARPRGGFTLVTCAVGPGFDFADFRFASDLPEHEATFSGVLNEWRDLL